VTQTLGQRAALREEPGHASHGVDHRGRQGHDAPRAPCRGPWHPRRLACPPGAGEPGPPGAGGRGRRRAWRHLVRLDRRR
jgi:hypothetical protein